MCGIVAIIYAGERMEDQQKFEFITERVKERPLNMKNLVFSFRLNIRKAWKEVIF